MEQGKEVIGRKKTGGGGRKRRTVVAEVTGRLAPELDLTQGSVLCKLAQLLKMPVISIQWPIYFFNLIKLNWVSLEKNGTTWEKYIYFIPWK